MERTNDGLYEEARVRASIGRLAWMPLTQPHSQFN